MPSRSTRLTAAILAVTLVVPQLPGPTVARAALDPPGPVDLRPRFDDPDAHGPLEAPLPRVVGHDQGAVRYRLPLPLPPARGGMMPTLELTYDSTRGASWVGQGFELDPPMIERDRRFGVPGLDHRKAFVFRDGGAVVPLVEIGPIEGSVTGQVEYRTLRDDDDRMFLLDALGTWRVRDREGGEQRYSSALAIPGTGPMVWRLSSAHDVHGNAIRYGYDATAAHGRLPRLTEIWYGGNDTLGAELPHPFHVVFYRDGQHEVPVALAGAGLEHQACQTTDLERRTDYSFGGAMTNLDGDRELLRGIAVEVAWPGTTDPTRRELAHRRVRAWHLHYRREVACQSPPQLVRVDQFDDDEVGTIASATLATFAYYDAEARQFREVPRPGWHPETFLLDVDGDARLDRVRCSPNEVAPGQPDGSFGLARPLAPDQLAAACPGGSASLMQYLFPLRCGSTVAESLSGSAEVTSTAFPSAGIPVEVSGDFTGDGVPDPIAWAPGTHALTVGAAGVAWWTGPPPGSGVTQHSPPAFHRTVTLGLGCGASLDPEGPTFLTDQAFDANGDGLLDLVTVFPAVSRIADGQLASTTISVGEHGAVVLASTGRGFALHPAPGGAGPAFLGRKRRGGVTSTLADWNGDGRLDLVSDRRVQINRGGWFGDTQETDLPLPHGVPMALRDVTGDGRVDVLLADRVITDGRPWAAPGRLARVTTGTGVTAELRYRTYESLAPLATTNRVGWVLDRVVTTVPGAESQVETITYGATAVAPVPGGDDAPWPRGFETVTSCVAARATRQTFDFGVATGGFGDVVATEHFVGCGTLQPVWAERRTYHVTTVPSRVGLGIAYRVLVGAVTVEDYDAAGDVATTTTRYEYVDGTSLRKTILEDGFVDDPDDDRRTELRYVIGSTARGYPGAFLIERTITDGAGAAVRRKRFEYDGMPWGELPLQARLTRVRTWVHDRVTGPDEPLEPVFVDRDYAYGLRGEVSAITDEAGRRTESCWDATRTYVIEERDPLAGTAQRSLYSLVTGEPLEVSAPAPYTKPCAPAADVLRWGVRDKQAPLPPYGRASASPVLGGAGEASFDLSDALETIGAPLSAAAYPSLPPLASIDDSYRRYPGHAVPRDDLFGAIVPAPPPAAVAPGPWPLASAVAPLGLPREATLPPVATSRLWVPTTSVETRAGGATPEAITIRLLATGAPEADGSYRLAERGRTEVSSAAAGTRVTGELRHTRVHAGGTSTTSTIVDAAGRAVRERAVDLERGETVETVATFAGGALAATRVSPAPDGGVADTVVVARDHAGRPTRTQLPDGSLRRQRVAIRYTPGGTRTVSFDLDAHGFVLAETHRDGLGRLREHVAYPSASSPPLSTHYRYDADGALTALTTPDGVTVRNAYDGRGLLIEQRRSAPGLDGWPAVTRSFRYTADGRLSKVIDGNGAVTHVARDDRGRVARIKMPPASIAGYGDLTYAYQDDPLASGYGRVESIATPSQTVTYQFDDRGRTVGERIQVHLAWGSARIDDEVRLGYAFAPTDEPARISFFLDADPSPDAEVNLRYDRNGRLRALWDGAVGSGRLITTISYLATGDVERHDDVGGGSAVYAYDVVGRRRVATIAAPGRPTWRQELRGLDDLGNPTERVTDLGDGAGEQRLTTTFDRMSRLTSAVDSSGYRFTASYQDSRPRSWTEVDAAGVVRGARYQYRAADPAAIDRLIDPTGAALVDLTYDGNGAVMGRRQHGVDDQLVVDPQGVVRGARGAVYFFDHRGEPTFTFDPTTGHVRGAVGDAIELEYRPQDGGYVRAATARLVGPAQLGATETRVFHADLFGHIAVVRRGGGDDLRATYTPWGEVLRVAGPLAGELSSGWRRSSHAGPLRQLGVRAFDPLTRRWTRPDPLLEAGLARVDGQDNDPYNLMRGNPLLFADPSGLQVACTGPGGAAGASYSGATLVCRSDQGTNQLSGNPGGNGTAFNQGTSGTAGAGSFGATVGAGVRGLTCGFGGAGTCGAGGYSAGGLPSYSTTAATGSIPSAELARREEARRARSDTIPTARPSSMSDTVRSLVVDARDRLDGRELQFLEDTAVEAQWNFVAAGWAAIDSYTTLPFVDRAVSTRLREAVAPELRFLRSTDAYAISYNTTGVALMVRGGHGLAVRARAVLPSAGTIHAAIAEAVVPIIDRLPSMAILSARNPGVTMNALAHQAQQLHALLAEFQAGAGQLRGMSAFVRRSTLAIATNGTRMIITVKSDALARHPQAVAEARQFLSTLTGLPLSDIFVGTVQHAEVAGQVLSGGATVIGVSRMVCPACVRWFWGNGRLVDLAPMVPFSRWLLPP